MHHGRILNHLIQFVLILSMAISGRAFADDLVMMSIASGDKDPRSIYTLELINLIMERTRATHGDYRIVNDPGLTRNRALAEMLKGDRLNLREETTNFEWEQKTIAVRIPLRRGLLSYRLLMVKEKNLAHFRSITTIRQLQNTSAGLLADWVTADVLKQNGFKVVDAGSYQGLFNMLSRGRFLYCPRGMSEIYGELQVQNQEFPDLRIEPTLALYIPQPTYLFVSPHFPELAKRVEEGLLAMIDDGSFESLFNKHFDLEFIKNDFKKRKIFSIKNEFVPDNTWAFERPDLWLKLTTD